MSDSGVVVSNLSASYGAVAALSGVSFGLGPGVTGLLGPNGAGKSTLLRILATAQEAGSGSVTAFGVDYEHRSSLRQARLNLGYLPQDPGFYPSFRVKDFVGHFALLKQIDGRAPRAQEVERVLAAVGLTDRSRSKIRELSGGMRQRLALACAILGDPELVVLDEPTVGLDPEQRVRFREMISELGADRTVILSTHQTDDIAALCNRVLVLCEGTIRFEGTAQELASRAQSRVWLSQSRDPGAVAGWATGDGRFRNIGAPPPGAALATPMLDDGYLIVIGAADVQASA